MSTNSENTISFFKHLVVQLQDEQFRESFIAFLDAVQDDANDLAIQISTKSDQILKLQKDLADVNKEFEDLKETEFDGHTAYCGIGKIEWRSDSLVLQSKMEEFTNKVASSYIQNQVTLF